MKEKRVVKMKMKNIKKKEMIKIKKDIREKLM
jgi:hypothetical protein